MPALKPKPFAKEEKLRSIKELPEWAQPAFQVCVLCVGRGCRTGNGEGWEVVCQEHKSVKH